MPGWLVLTAQDLEPTPPPEPEIMQTLNEVCKLSGRKQQQILEFIEVITAKKPLVGKWIRQLTGKKIPARWPGSFSSFVCVYALTILQMKAIH
ncbi:hypothetical protein GCM10027361_24180 [Erwinia aphidicola]